VTERLRSPDDERFPPLLAAHTRDLPAGTLIGRIHFATGGFPATWDAFRAYGPTKNRFDHHPGRPRTHPTRAVFYGAPVVRDPDGVLVSPLCTCLVEVFRDTGVVDVRLGSPYFVLFRLTRTVRLLDLVDGNWVTLAGGNALIWSGLRRVSREWSRAIYRTYDGAVDGLYYGCSNMPRGRSLLLYEQGRDALPVTPEVDLPLSHPGLWAQVEACSAELGLGLV